MLEDAARTARIEGRGPVAIDAIASDTEAMDTGVWRDSDAEQARREQCSWDAALS